MTIVGVVGDVRSSDPSKQPGPEIYLPFDQHPITATSLAVVARTAAEPMAVASAFREIVRGVGSTAVAKRRTPVELGWIHERARGRPFVDPSAVPL